MLARFEKPLHNVSTEASLDYVEIWRSANRLYPQSQNGFAGILGPHIIRDIFKNNLSIKIIRQLTIPKEQLDEIIDEANLIHGKLGIICQVTSGSVNQQWNATGRRILSAFDTQVEEIAIAMDDSVLLNASTITHSHNGRLEYFISDNRFAREREIVQSMWDTTAIFLKTNVSKKHAATIARTLIAMHLDKLKKGGGLDTRQAKIIAPEWDVIRTNLISNLDQSLRDAVDFNPHKLNEGFVSKLILGNKPQTATRAIE